MQTMTCFASESQTNIMYSALEWPEVRTLLCGLTGNHSPITCSQNCLIALLIIH